MGVTPVGDKDTVYADVAPPSFTLVGPEIETVIGSLSAIVAVAELAPELRETCDDSVVVIVPSVTVNDSAVSDNKSFVAVIVISCVAPAALLAPNVTVPEAGE